MITHEDEIEEEEKVVSWKPKIQPEPELFRHVLESVAALLENLSLRNDDALTSAPQLRHSHVTLTRAKH